MTTTSRDRINAPGSCFHSLSYRFAYALSWFHSLSYRFAYALSWFHLLSYRFAYALPWLAHCCPFQLWPPPTWAPG